MWEAGVAYSRFAAHLDVGGDVQLSEELVVASLGRRFGGRFTATVTGGAILGGQLDDEAGQVHDVGVGWIASLQGSAQVIDQAGWRPFVTGSLAFSTSSTATTPVAGGAASSLLAIDGRISVAAGWNIAGRVTPYVAARAFAGPVTWGEDTGQGHHHHQGAVGLDLTLPARIRLSVEWAPIGEHAFTVGIGFAFGRIRERARSGP